MYKCLYVSSNWSKMTWFRDGRESNHLMIYSVRAFIHEKIIIFIDFINLDAPIYSPVSRIWWGILVFSHKLCSSNKLEFSKFFFWWGVVLIIEGTLVLVTKHRWRWDTAVTKLCYRVSPSKCHFLQPYHMH